jgi:hypothetical protein
MPKMSWVAELWTWPHCAETMEAMLRLFWRVVVNWFMQSTLLESLLANVNTLNKSNQNSVSFPPHQIYSWWKNCYDCSVAFEFLPNVDTAILFAFMESGAPREG